jgi:hypothetical protein
VGGELRSAEQDEPVQPLIALGSKGQLQGVHWQVVGFQHRMGVEPGDDEHFGWSEYLLYNRSAALPSWSTPKTAGAGAPHHRRAADGGHGRRPPTWAPQYDLKYSYEAETTYVLGEFYWQVSAGRKPATATSPAPRACCRWSRAERGHLVCGRQAGSDTVAKAFKLDDKKDLLSATTRGPFVAARAWAAHC